MSVLGPANDIAIHHLHVKSALSDAKELARDFETGSWAAENEQEWLFVRSLAVKGNKHELRLQTSQALDSARHTAVFGGGSAATQANAVRFASLPELVAYLLRDLANGDAVFRWYWQRWAYLLHESKANAIGQLLWEQAATLPAIVEQLARMHQLEKIWHELQPQSADIIAERLFASISHLNAGNSPAVMQGQPTTLPTLVRIFERIPSVLRLWAPALRGLAATDARTRLAGYIAGVSHFPVLLAKYPDSAATLFFHAVQKLQWFGLQPDDGLALQPRSHLQTLPTRDQGQDDSHEGAKMPSAAAAEAGTMEEAGQSRPSPSPAEPAVPSGPRQSSDDTASPANQRDETAPSGDQPVQQHKVTRQPSDADETTQAESELKQAQLPQQPKIDEAPGFSGEFHTRLGGVFYLVNALTPYVEELLQSTSAELQGAGFRWLFELLRRFDAEPDNQLLHYLARQCGFENAEDLSAQPPIAGFDKIHVELQKRYPDIWNSELIHIPGIVLYTASHIDCYLPIASVRLAVRTHGLDVNPGWVPWLGRVITLHYRESSTSPATIAGE